MIWRRGIRREPWPPEEQIELQNFVRAGHLLALLHSKARRSLTVRKESGGDHGRIDRQKGARAGEQCLRRLSNAADVLSHGPFPDRPYHRPPAWGATRLGDLALSCLDDNSHKGPNIAWIDPVIGKVTKLFNPRRRKWEHHFRWDAWFSGTA